MILSTAPRRGPLRANSCGWRFAVAGFSRRNNPAEESQTTPTAATLVLGRASQVLALAPADADRGRYRCRGSPKEAGRCPCFRWAESPRQVPTLSRLLKQRAHASAWSSLWCDCHSAVAGPLALKSGVGWRCAEGARNLLDVLSGLEPCGSTTCCFLKVVLTNICLFAKLRRQSTDHLPAQLRDTLPLHDQIREEQTQGSPIRAGE